MGLTIKRLLRRKKHSSLKDKKLQDHGRSSGGPIDDDGAFPT
eukprot:CAMPEP_0119569128 /NCGR_PEP_ID=MMETSP1352-20130426/40776_1 /TAXON_ID=265584 /ORGANISM="Stauroneis constricta, Strain CCMP1120" /LENGTH=41 /DNA_ID= /DNA_START= /DNA_END= /DNA_ORIENTATION=